MKPIIIVVGMHRSGTSLCSNILSSFGVDMVDDIGRGPGNEEGHWERWEIVSLHDKLLEALGRPYGKPGDYKLEHDLPLPSDWRNRPETTLVQQELETFLRGRMRLNKLFGFKDPRICRFLPMWLDIFRNINLDPRYIICTRHPDDVAASLSKRDSIPLVAGKYRWLLYNVDIFNNIKDDFLLINYDDWFTKQIETIESLKRFVIRDQNFDFITNEASIINNNLNHGSRGSKKFALDPADDFYMQITGQKYNADMASKLEEKIRIFEKYQILNPFAAAAEMSISEELPIDKSRPLPARGSSSQDRPEQSAGANESRSKTYMPANYEFLRQPDTLDATPETKRSIEITRDEQSENNEDSIIMTKIYDIASLPPIHEISAAFNKAADEEGACAFLRDVYNSGVMFDIDGKKEILNDTSVQIAEGLALWYLTRELRPPMMIETGFGRGGSAAFFLTSMAPWQGKLTSIDPAYRHWAPDVGATYLKALGLGDYHTLIEMPSEIYLPNWIWVNPKERLKFAYVDGSHHFDGTLFDFMYFDKILEVGGVIGIDDAHAPAVRSVLSFIAHNLPYKIHFATSRLVFCQKIANLEREWDHYKPFIASNQSDWNVHNENPGSDALPNATFHSEIS